jgi:hypothetical protein
MTPHLLLLIVDSIVLAMYARMVLFSTAQAFHCCWEAGCSYYCGSIVTMRSSLSSQYLFLPALLNLKSH